MVIHPVPVKASYQVTKMSKCKRKIEDYHGQQYSVSHMQMLLLLKIRGECQEMENALHGSTIFKKGDKNTTFDAWIHMFTIFLFLNPLFAFKNYIKLKEQTSLLGWNNLPTVANVYQFVIVNRSFCFYKQCRQRTQKKRFLYIPGLLKLTFQFFIPFKWSNVKISPAVYWKCSFLWTAVVVSA